MSGWVPVESLNVTIINRYLCETYAKTCSPGSHGGESSYIIPIKNEFSVPRVKMRYVIAALTMRQVCFRSRTLLCVTASSEMCLAQLWDLDDMLLSRSAIDRFAEARDGCWECDSGLIYECRQRNQSAVYI